MKWNQDKSVILSILLVCLFAGLVLIGDMAAIWVCIASMSGHLAGLATSFGTIPAKRLCLLAAFWLFFSLPASFALLSLYRILHCFQKSMVFEAQTVRLMRQASWACAGGAGVCLAGGFFFPSLFIVALAAALMALIVRIVKNSFEAAIRMKDELDLTI